MAAPLRASCLITGLTSEVITITRLSLNSIGCICKYSSPAPSGRLLSNSTMPGCSPQLPARFRQSGRTINGIIFPCKYDFYQLAQIPFIIDNQHLLFRVFPHTRYCVNIVPSGRYALYIHAVVQIGDEKVLPEVWNGAAIGGWSGFLADSEKPQTFPCPRCFIIQ